MSTLECSAPSLPMKSHHIPIMVNLSAMPKDLPKIDAHDEGLL